MIRAGDPDHFNIWSHSQHMRALYRARARDEAEEMTCAAQAADLAAGMAGSGASLLDVGCGSGWFFHSLRRRGLALDYWGIDRTAPFIAIGREELPRYGLPPERLLLGEIESATGAADLVLCMNVLSNIDNWHRALDRIAAIARRGIILRESFGDDAAYALVTDRFLDPGVEMKVHVNRYARAEIAAFLAERGFISRFVTDIRTGGAAEPVIGYDHHWEFLVARRETPATGNSAS
jgi:SAM-dependent methyltransferase